LPVPATFKNPGCSADQTDNNAAIIAYKMEPIHRAGMICLAISVALTACGSATPSPTPTAAFPRLLTTDVPTTGIAPDATATESDTLTPIDLHVGTGFGNDWLQMYFTDPSNRASRQFSGGPDGPLVAAIDAARLSVDAAMYSLTLNSVRNALIRAHRRGLSVRVVMESDNLDDADPQALMQAGIPLLGDRQEGLMHDKFIVIDGTEVWTGSMNFTDSGAYSDNNSMVRMRSEQVAADYEAEFNQMYVNDLFGPAKQASTPDRPVTIEGTTLEVYFSPEDHVQDALVQLLSEAKSSIYFLAYSFTADPLGAVIRERAAGGVKVAGVMDSDQVSSNLGTEFDAFRADGLAVRLDGNPDQMHEKLMIIDGETVVVGSYNFSRSADTTNDENLIVIHDPHIAAQCTLEFVRIFGQAAP
jgi:phosphatidylserine/phosphatidylglycerophosphate/cardiolipin synthase-like enzyme